VSRLYYAARKRPRRRLLTEAGRDALAVVAVSILAGLVMIALFYFS
jgi:hypothetical protein